MRIAIIGFGTVGQGLVRLLKERGAYLLRSCNFNARVVAVSTSRGSLYNPEGLNLDLLLQVTNNLSAYPETPGLIRNMTNEQLILETNATVIAETSNTNIDTGEPAISYCRLAFEAGKHVITANKGPVALAYQSLIALARQNSVWLGYESTVMSGTPCLRLALQDLQGTTITAIRGILNGTTNYILSSMEMGKTYADALAEAQQMGFAEANPAADVEGWDTMSKVLILANAVMDTQLDPAAIPVTGITQITPQDIQNAVQTGQRIKLIGIVWRDEQGQVYGRVEPQRIPITHPLANVSGATNAISYTTDLMGDITLVGPGAGQVPTGFGLLADLLEIERMTP